MATFGIDLVLKAWSNRLSRRAALFRGGFAGLAATALTGIVHRSVSAQEVLPTPVVVPDSDESVSFLFVQYFQRGTWTPKPGEDSVYLLTLQHSADQTIYFSDRPERIVGTVPTQQFLDALGFTPANPPNAALVAQTDAGEDTLVIELFTPLYDVTAESLTYEARVLANYQDDGLRVLADRQGDLTMPDQFGAASLLIDDCPRDAVLCVTPESWAACVVVGTVNVGQCWNWGCLCCTECHDHTAECNKLPQCHGSCFTRTNDDFLHECGGEGPP